MVLATFKTSTDIFNVNQTVVHLNGTIMTANGVAIPTNTSPYIADTKIRYEVQGSVQFHTDDTGTDDDYNDLYSIGGGPTSTSQIQYIHDKYILNNPAYSNFEKYECLHIWFLETGAGGWGTGITSGAPITNSNANWVVVASQYANAYQAWWFTAMVLGHELAHALGLDHTFLYPYQCNDIQHLQGTTNNVMDYSSHQESYTECQLGIMHANIMGATGNTVIPNFVIEEYCNLDHTKDIHITAGSNPVWEDKKYLAGDIYIDANASLTVKCSLAMADGAKIIVQGWNGTSLGGGLLTVDGGTITNICGTLWDGIRVYGDRAKQQTTDYQGKVELKNGAVISNAVIGVRLGDSWAENGGIIVANDASFINNWKHVEFLSYTDPLALTQSQSKLRNSLFECTGVLNTLVNGTGQFISLWDVHGVNIVGNTFRNSAPAGTYANNSRGAGIYSIDADYYLGRSASGTTDYDAALCTLKAAAKPNIFDGLSTGVEYIWTLPNPVGLVALENEFKNITRGIVCNGENESFLWKNKFTWDNQFIKDPNFAMPPTFITVPFGIRMEDSKSFLIADNTFDWYKVAYPGDYSPQVLGIHVINSYSSSGATPQINRNVMENHVAYPNGENVIGNKFEFNNASLDVQGNIYTNLAIDWYVKPDPSGSLKSPQGDPVLGGRNFFTTCPNTSSSINFYLEPGASLFYNGDNLGAGLNTSCSVGSIFLSGVPDMPLATVNLLPNACNIYTTGGKGKTATMPIIVDGNAADDEGNIQPDQDLLKISDGTELSIAPNPAESHFTINYKCLWGTRAAQLRITDVLGRVKKQMKLPNNVNGALNISVEELGAKGLYYIILEEDGTITKTAKLITQ